MSSDCNGHDPNCHHCHITSPIPLGELLRTHPLRLQEDDNIKSSPECKQDSPVHTIEAIVHRNDSSSSQNGSCSDFSSIDGTSSENLPHDNNDSTVVPPFASDPSDIVNSLNLPLEAASKNSTFRKKFALLKPSTSFLHQFTKTHFYRKKFAIPKASTTASSSTNLSVISCSNSIDLSVVSSSLPSPARGNSFEAIYQTLSKYDRNGRKLSSQKFKDSHTQTTISRSFLKNNKLFGSTVSQLNLIRNANTKRRRNKNCCFLPWSLLIAGYLLLIVIAVVLAVAFGQRQQRIRGQSSIQSQRPNSFPGPNVVRSAPTQQNRNIHSQTGIRRPVKRTRFSNQGGRRARPVARGRGQQQIPTHRNFATLPPAPAPFIPFATTPRPTIAPPQSKFPAFQDVDFDYFNNFELDDSSFLIPNALPKFRDVTTTQLPPPAPFREVVVTRAPPPFREVLTQAPALAQEVRFVARAPTSATRKSFPQRSFTNNNAKQATNFQQQSQQQPRAEKPTRGQKTPTVEILKSWSNQNSDGTFSWGYINTDGSFKNETKGTDCVVRGMYGYVDKDTGETVTFPYEAGNPCNPDVPDYFYDYETGTLNVGGQVVQRTNKPSSNVPAARRRVVQ